MDKKASPNGPASFFLQDAMANRGRPQIQLLLFLLRISQWGRSKGRFWQLVTRPSNAFYRLLGLFGLGIDIPISTKIGTGVSIHHGVGLVIHNHAVLGENAVLRQNVTIGARRPAGGAPQIGNNVEFGAGSIVLGEITIGHDARIGAGSVVTADVPDGGVVVGNPARLLSRDERRST